MQREYIGSKLVHKTKILKIEHETGAPIVDASVIGITICKRDKTISSGTRVYIINNIAI